MKNILYTIILSFLFSSVCLADFQAGMDAYEAGDYATALKEWKVVAKQGGKEGGYARKNIGVLYDKGNGVAQDYKEAVKWFRLSAELNNTGGQYALGLMYDEGKGVAQDYKEAVKWFRLAAEQGDTSGQYALGVSYAKGEGVIKDLAIAHMWFNIAGRDGHEDAKTSRDFVESMMTSEQITKAQALARECINKKNYKDCG